jgi:polyvinyl alcohol dehydrogenase (cytochrome)
MHSGSSIACSFKNEGGSMKLAVFMLVVFAARAGAQTPTPGVCTATPPMSNPSAGARWNGWGADLSNTRSQTAQQAGLTDAQVPTLKLKWAFGIPTRLSLALSPPSARLG